MQMNEWHFSGCRAGSLNGQIWVCSNLGSHRPLQRVFHVHAASSRRAVYFGMTEEYLDGTEIPRLLVGDRSLCSSE